MISSSWMALPHGITLSCRSAGDLADAHRPLLVFLHGFPEAAFIWDATLEHFAAQGFRCLAPNLRGFEQSSSPADPALYRAKLLCQDIAALIDLHCAGQPIAALVAHDWGGAIAWNLANQMPQLMRRLVIINSPHPGTFLRELKNNPAQQAASSYMNFLCRPDAESLLAENDFKRLFDFFTRLGAVDGKYPWLTPSLKSQYRQVWSAGLTGGCNYYRASPLKPPLDASSAIQTLELPHEMLTVCVPTQVIWGMGDIALLPGLLDGLDAYVPDLRIHRVDDGTHWIIHEQPAVVHRLMGSFLSS